MKLGIVKSVSAKSRAMVAFFEQSRAALELVDERLQQKLDKFQLLSKPPFEFLFIYADHFYGNEVSEGAIGFERADDWKLNTRLKEYCARYGVDISNWEFEDPKTRQVCHLPMEQMCAQYERGASAVVAQIALEFGHSASEITPFLAGYGLDIEPIVAAHNKWANLGQKKTRAHKKVGQKRAELDWISFEISFSGDGRGLEENFKIRDKISALVSEELGRLGIGSLEGTSSGEDEFDLGFKVSDFGKARSVAEKIIRDSGIQLRELKFYSLDDDGV